MNLLHVAAGFTLLLTVMGCATHMMLTNRWPWQHKPLPTTPARRRHYCRTCLAKGQPAPAYDDWRQLQTHDLDQHWGR